MTSEPENNNKTTHEEAKELKTNDTVIANGRAVLPVSTAHVIDNSSEDGTLTNISTTVASAVKNTTQDSATGLSLLVGGITLSFLCEPDSWACPTIFPSENDVSSQQVSSMYCRCDHNCLQFGDCCPSYLARCESLNNSQCEASAKENSSSGAETARSHAFFDRYGTCVRDKLSIGYLVVARCPLDHVNQTVISQCQNSSVVVDKLVFSVSPRRHFVFKNKHCAICHSVGLDQQVPLTDLLACQGNSSDSAHAHTTCEMYARLGLGPAPYSFVRTCAVAWPYTMEEVENMLNSNSCTVQDKRLCRSYMFMGGATKVRNPHCSRCFSKENQDSFSQICERIKRVEQSGLSTLFDIGMKRDRVRDKIEAGQSDVQSCGPDEVLDESVNVCRKLLCLQNSTMQWGKCIENLTVIIEARMQPLPLGSTELIITFPQMTDKGFVDYCINISYGRSAIFGWVGNISYLCSSNQGVQDTLKITSTVNDTGTFIDESQECSTCNESLLFDLGYKELVSVKLRVRNISNIAKALQNLKEHFNATIEVSNLCYHGNNNQTETCRGATMRVYEDVPTRLIGSVLYGEVRTNDITCLYPLHNVFFDLVMTSPGKDMRLRRMLVCEGPDDANLLRCQLGVYNRSEAILLNNGSVWVQNTDLIYTPNQFVFNDDTVVTCNHLSSSNSRYFFLYDDDDDVQFYLSVACSALSVACLILTLVSYGLSKEQRGNTSRRMMAALALSLLLGHCLLYVHLPNPRTCFIVAAVTHFVWLVVFAWMSIISASMALTFFAARSRPSSYDRPFGPLCCLALGLPAAIVITCLALDFLQPAGFSVGYGKRTCCWIGHPEALLYFFYSPIALSVAVSFVCFVLTLYGIEVTAMATTTLKVCYRSSS